MSVRTTRIRLFAATAAAFATLALSACGSGDDGDGNRAAGSPAPGSAVTSAPPGASGGSAGAVGTPSGTPASPAAGTPSGGKPGTDKAATTGGSNGSTGKSTSAPAPNNGAVPACAGSDTKTTATVVARPLNHLLLTLTNTGSTSCDLIGYPAARFGEAQSVPPVFEDTKPQSVLRLAPGESGYAGVRLAAADGTGENGYTATTLAVPFADGTTAMPSLPAEGVYVDTALSVTYWQATLDEALN